MILYKSLIDLHKAMRSRLRKHFNHNLYLYYMNEITIYNRASWWVRFDFLSLLPMTWWEGEGEVGGWLRFYNLQVGTFSLIKIFSKGHHQLPSSDQAMTSNEYKNIKSVIILYSIHAITEWLMSDIGVLQSALSLTACMQL